MLKRSVAPPARPEWPEKESGLRPSFEQRTLRLSLNQAHEKAELELREDWKMIDLGLVHKSAMSKSCFICFTAQGPLRVEKCTSW